MPELPEVETISRALRPHLLGRRLLEVHATVTALRTPLDLKRLRDGCVGRTVVDVRRRGKHIVVELDDARALLLHLGMTGAFRICASAAPALPHDRLAVTLDDGRVWRFHDPRRFGSATVVALPHPGAWPECLAMLGPEPLGGEFTATYLRNRARARNLPVKNLLMDQRVVVGVGNIYANEALFRARISPHRQAARLGDAACARLAQHVREVLTAAIERGGTTISDFRNIDGAEGRFRTHLNVYGKDGECCPRCGPAAHIRRTVLAGRSTFHCPHCQH